MLIDSHCHLQHFDLDERRAALARARQRGVEGFLIPAVRLAEADDLLSFCESEPGVWCALGVHPHDAASWAPGDGRRLRGLLAHPKAVAVGECGLDFFYDHAPRDVQERVFRAQIEVALEVGLPVVVHNRDSNDAMMAVLEDPAYAGLAVDLHSFAGGPEMARRAIALGCHFGISGMVTFPRADNVREVLPEIPRDRLLVETDTPYLAPVPYRGRRNEPAYVVEVAERLARELGQSLSEIGELTTGSFRRLFTKSAPPT
ncbi:MAG: TatD family deoxyribonuclease [Thermoanaerobaculia bacterium]|nr:MAG: TatD family deoxyribonuclease [Thermoanaerobaculia bacterium]